MEILNQLSFWILVFLFYSFVGWLFEGTLDLVAKHKVVNRGFLIGPICPIYGVGVLIITLLLRDYNNAIILFFASMALCGILEYSTSYLMEKMFRVRWWDYTHEKFNIRGRICLKALINFGVMSVIVLKIINPIVFNVLDQVHPTTRLILAVALGTLLLADIVTSLTLIMKYRVTVGTVNADATDEITERVREILLNKGKLDQRLAKAFPTMKVDKNKAAKAHIQVETKAKVKAIKNETKARTKNIKAQTKDRARVKAVKTEAKTKARAIKASAKTQSKAVSKSNFKKQK